MADRLASHLNHEGIAGLSATTRPSLHLRRSGESHSLPLSIIDRCIFAEFFNIAKIENDLSQTLIGHPLPRGGHAQQAPILAHFTQLDKSLPVHRITTEPRIPPSSLVLTRSSPAKNDATESCRGIIQVRTFAGSDECPDSDPPPRDHVDLRQTLSRAHRPRCNRRR